MRTTLSLMAAALLLASVEARAQGQAASGGANSQPEIFTLTDIRQANYIDFGFRGTSFDGNSDPARFQRYRDMRDGGTVDVLRYFKDADAYSVKVHADHVGYRDQR